MNEKATLAEAKSFINDADKEVAQSDFGSSSFVNMLLYLSWPSQPDIAYAVNCAACIMFHLPIKVSKGYIFKGAHPQYII